MQTLNPGAEPHLSTEFLDPCPQATHNRGQLERADVGMVVSEDLCIGPTGHKLLQHLAAVVLGITHLAVELAIGKGAGTTLTELGIGFRIKATLPPPEPEGLTGAFLDLLATLEQ